MNRILEAAPLLLNCESITYEDTLTGTNPNAPAIPVTVDGTNKRLICHGATTPPPAEQASLLASLLAQQEHRLHDRSRLSSIREYSDSIFNSCPDGLIILDSQGCVVDMNRTLVRMCGVPRDRMLGTRGYHLLSTNSYRAAILALRETRSKGKSRFAGELRLPSGRNIPINVNSTLVTLGQDELILSVIRDLRHLDEKAEQSIRMEHSLARSIINASDAFLLADERGDITHINPALSNLLGCPGERFIGQPFDTILDRNSLSDYRRAFQRVWDTGYANLNTSFLHSDNTLIPTRILLVQLEFNGNPAIRIILQDMRTFLSSETIQNQLA